MSDEMWSHQKVWYQRSIFGIAKSKAIQQLDSQCYGTPSENNTNMYICCWSCADANFCSQTWYAVFWDADSAPAVCYDCVMLISLSRIAIVHDWLHSVVPLIKFLDLYQIVQFAQTARKCRHIQTDRFMLIPKVQCNRTECAMEMLLRYISVKLYHDWLVRGSLPWQATLAADHWCTCSHWWQKTILHC